MSKKQILACITLSLLVSGYGAAQLLRDNRIVQNGQSLHMKEQRSNSGPRQYDPLSLVSAKPGTIVFEGGYQTDPRDGGRPVALIAAALGVTANVFREAFSGVTPARGGHPSSAQVHANKRILLDALGNYGVTNDRLDEVSDYYRYRPESGGLWRHKPAHAIAVLKNDHVTSIQIIDSGAGYMTPPHVRVAGYPDLKIDVQLAFGTDLKTNGRIISMKLIE